MTELSKHQGVSRELKAEIASGKYAFGERLPSEMQLVKRFKVSRPTVARALRDLEVAGLIERRAGSGTYLKTGSAPVGEPVPLLGAIIPDLEKIEIFEAICGELAGLAKAHHQHLLWGRRRGAAPVSGVAEMKALCEESIERGCAGVFFAPLEQVEGCEAANREVADRLRQAGVPMVLIDRDYQLFPGRSEFDLVALDHFRGGYLLAEHLIKLGCQKIAFVTRPFSAPTVQARMAGARSALIAHGREVPGNFVQVGDPTQGVFVRQVAAGRTFDAVICANDHTAAELLQGLARLKIAVPRDLRVVGFDDVRYATLLSVPLTTVHQPCRDIALTAFRALQERIATPGLPPRQMLLTPQLVVRESCGAYAAAR